MAAYIPVVALALLVVTVLVYLIRHPSGDLTMADGVRIKWLLVAIAAWTVAMRGLTTEATDTCAVDSSALAFRASGWMSAFLNCSPKLLSGGPIELITFVWVWAGILLIPAAIGYFIIRAVRRSPRISKE
jgi:hypothetical protein